MSSLLGPPASIGVGGSPTPEFTRSISDIVKQAFARNRRSQQALPAADATASETQGKRLVRYRVPGLLRGSSTTVAVERESAALQELARFGDELHAAQAQARRLARAAEELARLNVEIDTMQRRLAQSTARRDELAANMPDQPPKPLGPTRWARQVTEAIEAAIAAEPELAEVLRMVRQ